MYKNFCKRMNFPFWHCWILMLLLKSAPCRDLKAHYGSVEVLSSVTPAVRSIINGLVWPAYEWHIDLWPEREVFSADIKNLIRLDSSRTTETDFRASLNLIDLMKALCSVGDCSFFQISSGCLHWPALFLLTPSPQTRPPETPPRAETPPSAPPTRGSPSSSTAPGRSSASRWGRSGCMHVTVTSTPSTTWSG